MAEAQRLEAWAKAPTEAGLASLALGASGAEASDERRARGARRASEGRTIVDSSTGRMGWGEGERCSSPGAERPARAGARARAQRPTPAGPPALAREKRRMRALAASPRSKFRQGNGTLCAQVLNHSSISERTSSRLTLSESQNNSPPQSSGACRVVISKPCTPRSITSKRILTLL